jgi:hypothetical protein
MEADYPIHLKIIGFLAWRAMREMGESERRIKRNPRREFKKLNGPRPINYLLSDLAKTREMRKLGIVLRWQFRGSIPLHSPKSG